MLAEIKETWGQLRRAEPGNRFTAYHRHHQATAHGKVSRVITVVIGILLIALGIIALPAPGPGTLVIALGAAFIARESRAVATALDWLEVKLRRAARWIRSGWRAASPLQRMLVALAGVGVLGAAIYMAYTVVLRA